MDTKPTFGRVRRLPRQQKGGLPLMLSQAITNIVMACCESFINLRLIVPFTDGANTLHMMEADIKQTELGTIITLPPLLLPGTANPATGRYFNGSGPPSAITLSSSFIYISTSSMTSPSGPDFYFDIADVANPNMWVCITAGSNSTSVWFNLTGCP